MQEKTSANDRAMVIDGACKALRKYIVPHLKHPATLKVQQVSYLKLEGELFFLWIGFTAENDRGGLCRDSVTCYCDNKRIYRNRKILGRRCVAREMLIRAELEALDQRIEKTPSE